MSIFDWLFTGYSRDNNSLCTIDIDECESNPCQNEANCSDMLDGFVCECVFGEFFFMDTCFLLINQTLLQVMKVKRVRKLLTFADRIHV